MSGGAGWIDTQALGGLLRSAWRPKEPELRPSWPHLLAAQAIFAGTRSAVRIGQVADEIFYPSYQRQTVREPLFIFANARSGTTLLHNLISLDEEHFTPLRLHHTVFPAVSLQRIIQGLGFVDRRFLKSNLAALVQRSDDYFFGVWKGIHDTGLGQLEEDEALFVYTLLSPSLLLAVPEVASLHPTLCADDRGPKARQKFAAFYANTLQRLLFAADAGDERRLLNKSIWLPSRIQATFEVFPDARFVYLVRHPYETIPSYLNFMYAVWQKFYPAMPRKSAPLRQFCDVAIDYYQRSHRFLESIPAEQRCIIRFGDLVRDPVAVMRSVYSHFSYPWTPALETRATAAAARRDAFRSQKRYTLEDFGIEKGDVFGDLKDVFAAYGFEP